MDGQRVARLGALDVERAGLGIDEAEVDLVAGQVVDRLEGVVESILRPQPEGRPRLDLLKRCDATEGVGVLFEGRLELNDVDRRKLARQLKPTA